MSETAACTLIQEEPDRKTERYPPLERGGESVWAKKL